MSASPAANSGRSIPRFAAEQFILMTVTGPRRRALGLGKRLDGAELRAWIDNTVALFLDGCRPAEPPAAAAGAGDQP